MAKKGTKRPRKAISDAEMAAVLAYAELHGDEAAGDKFGLSRRTILRRKADIAAGRCPELSQLVAVNRKAVTESCQDLLLEVYESGLRELNRRIKDPKESVKFRDLVGAVHILGNQRMARDAVKPPAQDKPEPITKHERPVRSDSESAPHEANGGAASRGNGAADVPTIPSWH